MRSKTKAGEPGKDAIAVKLFMEKLQHPLKAEIETLRGIILKSNSRIRERIKWNAPSYYYTEDMVTFNPRATAHVHLVFHHPFIVQIDSDILEGDYKDRRMVYFRSMKEIKEKKKEMERIMNELINSMNKQ